MTPDLTREARRRLIGETFQQRFGASPALWVRAPACVDLMGTDTDFHGGCGLGLAISRDTWIAARPRRDGIVRLFSVNLDSPTNFFAGINARNPLLPWADHVRGVAVMVKAQGLEPGGFDGVIHSTVPIGSGLGSSVALQCAAATVLEELGGWKLDPLKKVLLCREARTRFMGLPGGILGPWISCAARAGGAILVDGRDLSSQAVKLPASLAIVLCDTRSKRESVLAECRRRLARCEEGARRLGVSSLGSLGLRHFKARVEGLPPGVAAHCRFILEESERAVQLARALAAFERRAIRRLTTASFLGACELCDLGTPALRMMRECVTAAPGFIGVRQAGAGLGGSLIAFVERARTDAFAVSVREAYLAATRVKPDVYPVEAAAGAGRIRFRG